MQRDTGQAKYQSSSPSRQRSRKRKGRKKDDDRKRVDDVKLINFHENPPKYSFLKELALQLDRLGNGTKSAIVYSYATSLPSKFDPRQAPEDLQGDENLKQRLSAFYNLRTVRKCPVNYHDEASDQKKRCPQLSRGIAEIIVRYLRVFMKFSCWNDTNHVSILHVPTTSVIKRLTMADLVTTFVSRLTVWQLSARFVMLNVMWRSKSPVPLTMLNASFTY